ncbi:hypothetical protein DPEC_G00299890 [Dallia pectoralis]|uniref:Uncharacterized protein n=1 Tax=Dallia pectoralis TaxID=75939 RepID=A0ACC2FG47_DALPE|nr:hypothetical protein DPEC_G00299890 [Dallia pectoralis]
MTYLQGMDPPAHLMIPGRKAVCLSCGEHQIIDCFESYDGHYPLWHGNIEEGEQGLQSRNPGRVSRGVAVKAKLFLICGGSLTFPT